MVALDPEKVGIICQARLTSSRFPNKILFPLLDKPVIQWHLDRLRGLPWKIVVCIPDNTSNGALWHWLEEHRYEVFGGSEEDVTLRFAQCATKYKFEHIIRTCADSVLISKDEIVDTMDKYQMRKLPLAVGDGVQIFSKDLLLTAVVNNPHVASREHVWPWMSLTLDYPDDIDRIEYALDKGRPSYKGMQKSKIKV